MLSKTSRLTQSSHNKRSVISAMKEVNLALANVHKSLAKQIDISRYEHATTYVNRYVSYTDIWNLKFNYNIESPEVALLQHLHLEYILDHFEPEAFQQERQAMKEIYNLFYQYSPFSDEQLATRKERMQASIEEQMKGAK